MELAAAGRCAQSKNCRYHHRRLHCCQAVYLPSAHYQRRKRRTVSGLSEPAVKRKIRPVSPSAAASCSHKKSACLRNVSSAVIMRLTNLTRNGLHDYDIWPAHLHLSHAKAIIADHIGRIAGGVPSSRMKSDLSKMFHVKHFYAGRFVFNYFFAMTTTPRTQKGFCLARPSVTENVIADLRFYPSRPNPATCGCYRIPIIQAAVGRVIALHGFQGRFIGCAVRL